ncbi:hypothetical protein MLD38_015810 [Melastoma candidum]|uniref:Uncharacterized protein n=1 Tax=Melastoma candidum TaxID=119954 RepID=A0ACB9RL07_9MYRT|nr:hypothetical protein MLD38_015810 [Melastoma candidum]
MQLSISSFKPTVPTIPKTHHRNVFSAIKDRAFRSSFLSFPLLNPRPLKSLPTHNREPLPRRRVGPVSLFTGLVEEIGRVKSLGPTSIDAFTITINAETTLGNLALGDSVSVNGTCLTVTEFSTAASEFSVGLSPETLRKTNLGDLVPGSMVNLERAVRPTDRMGGHFVQGHVDGTGVIVGKDREGDSLWVKVRVEDAGLMKYVVPKGFIAVDGTSLTVCEVSDEEGWFNFMLVRYTQEKVVIANKAIGEKVNLEVDILGKYVERLLKSGFLDSINKSP